MRAAQCARIGNQGGPPAFAPVILLGHLVILTKKALPLGHLWWRRDHNDALPIGGTRTRPIVVWKSCSHRITECTIWSTPRNHPMSTGKLARNKKIGRAHV